VNSLDFDGFIQIVTGTQAGKDSNQLGEPQPFIVIWQRLLMQPN
jgi:hypothetical protein